MLDRFSKKTLYLCVPHCSHVAPTGTSASALNFLRAHSLHHWAFLVGCWIFGACAAPAAQTPFVRCHSFLVNPSTGPVAEITVTAEAAWSGTLTVTPPDGWTIDPQTHDITLQAGESKCLPYRIIKARETADNAYPFALTLSGGATATQTVRTASAPYGKPKVDAKLDDWKDAIPLRFGDPGAQTTLRTYWDNTAFYLAIEVEQNALIPSDKKTADGRFDALQLYLAPKGAAAKRHEFLIEPVSKTKAICKRLGGAQEKSAAVAVKHSNGITAYEIALPLDLLDGIRVDAGREFRFGLLVHDPGGRGLRDLGVIMNRPASGRVSPPTLWTQWPGGCWDTPPYDGGTEFGFCSSIH